MKQESWEELIKKALASEASEHPIFEGHQERFNKRLEDKNQRGRLISLKTWLAVAASTVLGIGVWIYIERSSLEIAHQLPDSTAPEVAYASEYFHQNLPIDVARMDYQDETVTKFLQQIQELESEYKRLDSLYRVNISNELLIKGMVENFQYRLTIMQKIKSYIEVKKNSTIQQNG